jgi:predicted nuclease of restriction endonuclease-like (RecB) superfamily
MASKSLLAAGYAGLLAQVKQRVRIAQVKAALSANRELVLLYWDIGRAIVERQRLEKWGAGVIERLAADLRKEFPGIAGFSRQNIYRMRSFYLAYASPAPIVSQPARQTPKLTRVARPTSGPPKPMALLPWFHNVVLVETLKDPRSRLWYARKAIEHGWSRAILQHQVDSGLRQREGGAITNFAATLPAPQSDLAEQTLKDPYVFDFLSLDGAAREREFEEGLLAHIQKFLVELGVGFAFVGHQYRLEYPTKISLLICSFITCACAVS